LRSAVIDGFKKETGLWRRRRRAPNLAQSGDGYSQHYNLLAKTNHKLGAPNSFAQ
jgi:hypothetical protein